MISGMATNRGDVLDREIYEFKIEVLGSLNTGLPKERPYEIRAERISRSHEFLSD